VPEKFHHDLQPQIRFLRLQEGIAGKTGVDCDICFAQIGKNQASFDEERSVPCPSLHVAGRLFNRYDAEERTFRLTCLAPSDPFRCFRKTRQAGSE